MKYRCLPAFERHCCSFRALVRTMELAMHKSALPDDQVSASLLAHEVNSAASALLINAHAALRWLDKSPSDVAQARRSLELLIGNGDRVCKIVSSLRPI